MIDSIMNTMTPTMHASINVNKASSVATMTIVINVSMNIKVVPAIAVRKDMMPYKNIDILKDDTTIIPGTKVMNCSTASGILIIAVMCASIVLVPY